MKILVTGGNGFIGSNLIKRLVKDGNSVYSLDNLSTGYLKNEIQGCTYVYRSILELNHDIVSLSNDSTFDLCFHLAGLSRIQPSFFNPNETFKANVEGTQTVLEWARRNKVKVIYAGSSSRHHNPYQSPYACYKYLGEELCKMYNTTYDLKVEIARFYNVYGPNEIVDGDWAAVIGIWRRQIRDSKPLTVVGDGEQRRDFTHVDDIVDGLIKIALSKEHHIDAWELGTGFNYSINEVAQMFVDKFKNIIHYIPNQPGNYKETLRENTDAVDRLNWKPTDKLKEYINSL